MKSFECTTLEEYHRMWNELINYYEKNVAIIKGKIKSNYSDNENQVGLQALIRGFKTITEIENFGKKYQTVEL